jgi:hypothetical protein
MHTLIKKTALKQDYWLLHTQHCVLVDGDSDEFITLQTACLHCWRRNSHHKAVVFFNPRQKSVKVLTTADCAAVLEYVVDNSIDWLIDWNI